MTAGSRSLSKHEWSTCPVERPKAEFYNKHVEKLVRLCVLVFMTVHFPCVLLYLSMRTFLQRGLYHNVALHAHLQLRDLGRHTAVTRGPQRSQELSSSDRVYYHCPILKITNKQTDTLVCRSAITQCFCFYFV